MGNEIEIFRGDTSNITVTIKDSNGTIYDLTGYTAKLTVKTNSNDTDSNAKIGPITATISAPTTGIAVFVLTETNTDILPNTYVYDIQINDGTTDIKTVVKDEFIVTDDVTKG